MNTFDFIKKFYKTAVSAVIVCNTANTIYWSNNLDKVSLSDDEIIKTGGVELFKKPIYQLTDGEYHLAINTRTYHYNVKTVSDRTNSYVVIEIGIESINASFVNSEQISQLFTENDTIVKRNTQNILSIIEGRMKGDEATLNKEDYQNILGYSKLMVESNRCIASIVETRHEVEHSNHQMNNITQFAIDFVENCDVVLKPKEIKMSIECVEDIYAPIGQVSFNNLCVSIINRLLCISDGYVDKITLSLQMTDSSNLDFCAFTDSIYGVMRIPHLKELKSKLAKNDAIGTDLFAIKYFCEKHGGHASQKVSHRHHNAIINVQIPNCETRGAMLLNYTQKPKLDPDKLSHLEVSLYECLSYVSTDYQKPAKLWTPPED